MSDNSDRRSFQPAADFESVGAFSHGANNQKPLISSSEELPLSPDKCSQATVTDLLKFTNRPSVTVSCEDLVLCPCPVVRASFLAALALLFLSTREV